MGRDVGKSAVVSTVLPTKISEALARWAGANGCGSTSEAARMLVESRFSHGEAEAEVRARAESAACVRMSARSLCMLDETAREVGTTRSGLMVARCVDDPGIVDGPDRGTCSRLCASLDTAGRDLNDLTHDINAADFERVVPMVASCEGDLADVVDAVVSEMREIESSVFGKKKGRP